MNTQNENACSFGVKGLGINSIAELSYLFSEWKQSGFDKICIFGGKGLGKKMEIFLNEMANVKVDFYCDNAESEWNENCISPKQLESFKHQVVVFISPYNYQSQIMEQLSKMGIRHIIPLVSFRIFQDYILECKKIEMKKSEFVQQGSNKHRGKLELLADENYEKDATKAIGNAWIETDRYYDDSENNFHPEGCGMDVFWGKNSTFLKYFEQLDCSSIVELACGHGRHIQKYLNKAKAITLVDINEENIEFCKKRYSNDTKIKYVVNAGSNFSGIEDASQTSVFSYDAMVHFELLDIISYIKDANRILTNGGKILFHHSNAAYAPEKSWIKKPHSRNFMSADIFAYLALRHGFTVLSQDIFSWGYGMNFYEHLDCLSLCQKIRDIN
ncbi:MAG: class I SAM-dependent methyltransferase [Fibromonadales bacterium]|nr:class I SAM-dependent methyltransferase [Fibromonadales bacterium]